MDPQMVAGEQLDVLRRALQQMKVKKTRGGTVRVSATLDPELGLALQRAIMRIERELIGLDIDRMSGSGIQTRTPEERQAGAFVALVLRVAEARRVPDSLRGAVASGSVSHLDVFDSFGWFE